VKFANSTSPPPSSLSAWALAAAGGCGVKGGERAVAEDRLKLRYGTWRLDRAPRLDLWWYYREKY